MAKINVKFDNENYIIDEASLSSAAGTLRSHLSTVMNGTGAVIDFGDTSYNVDSNKLSNATNSFIACLGTIAGTGTKVVVDGVEYEVDSTKLNDAVVKIETVLNDLSTDAPSEERLEGDGSEYYTATPTALSFRSSQPLDEFNAVKINGVTVDPANYTLEEGSTIVTFPIDYLKDFVVGGYEVTVESQNGTAKGDFFVKSPELNEYGFYYNQPYVGYLAFFGCDGLVVVHNNGTLVATDLNNGGVMTFPYTVVNNKIVVNSMYGVMTVSFSNNGQSAYIEELAAQFELSDTVAVADEDYLYIYFDAIGGFEARCLDRTKEYYADVKTGINGIDTVKLGDFFLQAYAITDEDGKVVDRISNVKEIPNIPSTVTAFGNYTFDCCYNLTSVTVPDGITTIGDYAFSECSSLESIYLPSSITYIGKGIFYWSNSLTNIVFGGTVAQWNAIDGLDEWNIASTSETYVQCSDGRVNLNEDDDSAVLEGAGQEYYTMAPHVLSFRSTAPLGEFKEVQVNGQTVDPSNYTLEEGSTIVTFPIDYLNTLVSGKHNVTVVSQNQSPQGDFFVVEPVKNEYGFYYNQPYTCYVSVLGAKVTFFVRDNGTFNTIVNGGTETGTYEISGNTIISHNSMGTLTSTISDDGTEIYCAGLGASFVIGDQSVVADDEYMYTYNEDLGGYEATAIDKTKASYKPVRTGINGFDTVKLASCMFVDDSQTTLVGNANMTAIPEIPESVTQIGLWAFYGCTNLSNVVIPDSITYIDEAAFSGCTSLTSVVIPGGVTKIGLSAFQDCTNLTSVTVKATTPPVFDRGFYGCSDGITIYVPADSVDAYKNASGWREYASNIQAMPTI